MTGTGKAPSKKKSEIPPQTSPKSTDGNALRLHHQEKVQVVVLYVSDHDPEGDHIPKVLTMKLMEYGCLNARVRKIALLPEQVKQFDLQSNIGFTIGAKHRQKRYVREYLDRYGEVQYEVDALSNIDLARILEIELRSLMDFEIPKGSDEGSGREVVDWKKEHYT